MVLGYNWKINMNKFQLIGGLYRGVVKPVLFAIDAETVHNRITGIGEGLENCEWVLEKLLAFKSDRLHKQVLGVDFPNPIGLAAGFDWDGHLAKVIGHVGFGFNTVGTVTAKPYSGNLKPRLGRLPKSRSLFVNKGFMSEGAQRVMERLDRKRLDGHVVGISVGSSNLPEVNTINKAIEDYLFTFEVFKNKAYVKYFELNISCPNAVMAESFTTPANFSNLVKQVAGLKIKQPIFVKMPNEIEEGESDGLVREALKLGVRGFIIANLAKNRNNPVFDREEMKRWAGMRGNFSGKPTEEGANNLIRRTREKFGKGIAIIGCGGVFSAEDVKLKFAAGADLVQLITGMIFEGPQLAGEINSRLVVDSGESPR